MNLRHYSIAILISALPAFALAQSHGISLAASDFVAAERVAAEGDTIIKVKLSKSGKAKFKKLGELKTDSANVHTEIAGVVRDLKLRTKIDGDSLEMGPFAQSEAVKIETEINRN